MQKAAQIFTENICNSPVLIEEDITNIDDEEENVNTNGNNTTAPITLQVLYTGSSYIEVTREFICKSPSVLIEEHNITNDEEITATNGNSTHQNTMQVLHSDEYYYSVT